MLCLLPSLLIGSQVEAATYHPFAKEGDGKYSSGIVVSSLRGDGGQLRVTSDQYAVALNQASGENYSASDWAQFFAQGKVVSCTDKLLSGGIQRLDNDNNVSAWNRSCKDGEQVLVALDNTGREVGWVSLSCLNPIMHEVSAVQKNCRILPTPAPPSGAACGVGSGTYYFGNYSDACGMAGTSPTTPVTVCD